MLDGYCKLNLIVGSGFNKQEVIDFILENFKEYPLPLSDGYQIENYRNIILKPGHNIIYGRYLNSDFQLVNGDLYVPRANKVYDGIIYNLPDELDVAVIGNVKHHDVNGFRKGTYIKIVCLKDVDTNRVILKL